MTVKRQLIRGFVAITTTWTLAACSGNATRISGSQCPKRWDPVQMNIHPANKREFKETTLPDGEYQLSRAMLHFKGDATESSPEGFQVLVREDVPHHAKDATLVSRADCFRNANVDRAYSASVDGLTSVTVKNGKVVTSTAKSFGFKMSETGKFELSNGPSQRKAEAPQTLFKDASETFVVHWTDDDYEVRTKGRATNGEYALMTFLHRVK